MTDPFWFDAPEILWDNTKLSQFFPTDKQTMNEKMNSIVRLCLYITVFLYAYKRDTVYLWTVVGALIFTYYIHNNYESVTKSEDVVETLENDLDVASSVNCTKPTIDNPFMNVTMKDYTNIKDGKIVDRAPACDASDPVVKADMDKLFNNNLYSDVSDVFGKFNSQRQFYTMPWTTVPPDPNLDFPKWLYLNPKTCKEDQDYCNRYEDLRAKAPVVYNPNENPQKTEK